MASYPKAALQVFKEAFRRRLGCSCAQAFLVAADLDCKLEKYLAAVWADIRRVRQLGIELGGYPGLASMTEI
jgi:hypothetical protein